MGERSSLFLDGAEHLRQRRLLLPAFHGERMSSHAVAMRTAADAAIASWPIEQPFAIHPQMRTITFETIIRTVFGFGDDDAGSNVRALMRQLFALYSSRLGTLLSLPAMRFDAGAWSPWRQAGTILRHRRSSIHRGANRGYLLVRHRSR
jgi:cytochrome P450